MPRSASAPVTTCSRQSTSFGSGEASTRAGAATRSSATTAWHSRESRTSRTGGGVQDALFCRSRAVDTSEIRSSQARQVMPWPVGSKAFPVEASHRVKDP